MGSRKTVWTLKCDKNQRSGPTAVSLEMLVSTWSPPAWRSVCEAESTVLGSIRSTSSSYGICGYQAQLSDKILYEEGNVPAAKLGSLRLSKGLNHVLWVRGIREKLH